MREILLERVDGEERLVRFLLRGSDEVEVHEHLDLERVLRDVHDDGCEKVGDVAPRAHHAEELLHAVELLAGVGGAQRLVQLARLVSDLKDGRGTNAEG